MATALEVCEARDRKGLYARAPAGMIEAFTGISDRCEAPDDAEITIDTAKLTPEAAAQKIIVHFGERGVRVGGAGRLPGPRPMRKTAWRLGRRLYMLGRGEARNRIETNGEARLQRCVHQRAGNARRAAIFDVGANEGAWLDSFFRDLAGPARDRYRVHAFEPVPSTLQRLGVRMEALGVDGLVSRFPLRCPTSGARSRWSSTARTGAPAAWSSTMRCARRRPAR